MQWRAARRSVVARVCGEYGGSFARANVRGQVKRSIAFKIIKRTPGSPSAAVQAFFLLLQISDRSLPRRLGALSLDHIHLCNQRWTRLELLCLRLRFLGKRSCQMLVLRAGRPEHPVLQTD